MTFENSSACENTPICMSLRPSSPAYPLISKLENKSGYACRVLEDFLEVNPNPDEYFNMLKEERLEKYFGEKPSRKETSRRILDTISKMKNDKERLLYEVEYVHFFQEEGDIFTKDIPFDCFAHLIVNFAKNLTKNGGPKKSMRYSFLSDFSNFRSSCILKCSNEGWVETLEEKENLLDAGEQLFVLLVGQWFLISSTLSGTDEYTSGQIVECVLEFMESHPDSAYRNAGFSMSLFAHVMKDKFMAAATLPVPVI